MKKLPLFKNQIKNTLVEAGLNDSIQLLKEALSKEAEKYDDLLSLEKRYKDLQKDNLHGILTKEESLLIRNKITKELFGFIKELEASDFKNQKDKTTIKKKKSAKKGKILHNIPPIMQCYQKSDCVIRIAMDEEILLEDIQQTENTKIQAIRIADIMKVELQNLSEQEAFRITPFNNPTQYILEDDYTQWEFSVEPTQAGQHYLMLRVSTITIINGNEYLRDVVLKQVVEVITPEEEAIASPSKAAFQTLDYAFVTTSGYDIEYVAASSYASMLSRYGIILFLFLAGGFAWAMYKNPALHAQFECLITDLKVQFTGNKEYYEEHLKEYPDSPCKEDFCCKIVDDLTEKEFMDYLDAHPDREYPCRERIGGDYDHNGKRLLPFLENKPIAALQIAPREDAELFRKKAVIESPPSPPPGPTPPPIPSYPPRIKIGTKEWMTENIKVPLKESWNYNDLKVPFNGDGRLYTWASAVQACKKLGEGWRMPYTSEWEALLLHYGKVEPKKDRNAIAFLNMIPKASLNIQYSGYRKNNGDFFDRHTNKTGAYWTANASNIEGEYWAYMVQFGTVRRTSNHPSYGFACRCVRERKP